MAAVSSNKVSVKWALFYVVVSIILTYVYQFLNIDTNSTGIKYIGFIPFIAFMLLAQKEYRDQLGGFMSFGEGFLAGFKYTVIATILGVLFSYIYMTLLNPQLYQRAIETMRTSMQQKGTMSDEQIDKTVAIFSPFVLSLIAFIFLLIVGVIIALIGAAIFKKDRPMFINQDPENYTDPAV